MTNSRKIFVRSLLALGMLAFAPSCIYATSAQLELTDPVLPFKDGLPAKGNAFFGVVAGGGLYNSAGNIGCTIPLGTAGKGKLYFCGDIFTWVKNPSLTQFDPKRVVYTLEPGYDYVSGRNEFRFFIKHQSFHDPDTLNTMRESYELYGVDYRCLSTPRPKYEFRIGYYASKRVVDYQWDFQASTTFDLSKRFGNGMYLELWLHGVTDGGSRGGFVDYAGEVGANLSDGLSIFGRYEVLHDIDQFGGETDHHFLAGPKYSW